MERAKLIDSGATAPAFYDVHTVARLLDLTEITVQGMIRRGELRGFKVAGKYRIRRVVFDAFIAKLEEKAAVKRATPKVRAVRSGETWTQEQVRALADGVRP